MIDRTLSVDRAPTPPAPAPVFVDASGRRQRRVRRAGRILAIPAAGYLALLASSAVGGPTLDAPFLPGSPARVAPAPATPPETPATATGPVPSAGPAAPASTRHTGAPTARATAPRPSTAQATAPSPAPTGATATPAPSPTHGKSTAQPGHRPTKTP